MNPWGSVCRVYDRHGVGHVRTLGSTDPAQAKDLKAFARWLKKKRKWDVLDLIIARACTLAEAHDAHELGELAEFAARVQTAQRDVDLSPLVSEWAGRGRRSVSAKYLTQVRRLIPEGEPFPVSRFTRGPIGIMLDALDVDRATKNRYRAALMQFGRWLVQREILEHNPVRDVDSFGENNPRTLWMEWEDARKVCDAAHPAYKGLFAILYGSGAEIGAALKLRHQDFDRKAKTIRLRGSKTAWRNRVVRLEDWAWPRLSFVLDGLTMPDTQVFYQVTYDQSYLAHKAALKAAGLEKVGYTLHDARHTYAVNALRKGYDEQVVAHQLGHKDATMVRKVYGRFVPKASDYEIASAPARNASGEG